VVVAYRLPGGGSGHFETMEALRWGCEQGDAVAVIYDPANHSDGTIVSFPQLWFPLVFKFLVAAAGFWGGVKLVRWRK
jgi:hypothetical protein